MRALVIVDAWEIWDPFMVDEAHALGAFLNEVCKLERAKGTLIVHSHGEYTPMPQIEIMPEDWELHKDDTEVVPVPRLNHYNPNGDNFLHNSKRYDIDEVYFCGFHFGKCVHHHAVVLMGEPNGAGTCEANIIVNLSSVLPDAILHNSWVEIMEDRDSFHYHLWSRNGIEEIKLA